MTDTDELKRRLGLLGNESLEPVASLQLDTSDVGLGFAAASAVWSEIDLMPNWQELALGAPVRLFAWEEQGGVYRLWLPMAGDVTLLGGAHRQVEERVWHIDARTDEASVRVSLASGDDIVLRLLRTECQFFRVGLQLDVPSLASLTSGLDSQAWLHDEYQVLAASPSVADRVAAVGLVLRLWLPTSAAARRQLLEGALTAESPLVQLARQWATALSPTVCGRCAAMAVDEAENLEDALASIDSVVEQGDEAVRALATYIALERDRLESLVAVLALRGEVSRVRSALERLDAQASLLLSQMSSSGIEHPLLERAGEVEPFAWWSALASP
jgi:hypothetical protein